MCYVTQETLWAGPELKSAYAYFHLQKMQQALNPPALDGYYAAIAATGAIVDS